MPTVLILLEADRVEGIVDGTHRAALTVALRQGESIHVGTKDEISWDERLDAADDERVGPDGTDADLTTEDAGGVPRTRRGASGVSV